MSESSSMRYRWNKIDKNSTFDTLKLPFRICMKNTWVPGDGGRNTFDRMYLYFEISICLNFRHDIQHNWVFSRTSFPRVEQRSDVEEPSSPSVVLVHASILAYE